MHTIYANELAIPWVVVGCGGYRDLESTTMAFSAAPQAVTKE